MAKESRLSSDRVQRLNRRDEWPNLCGVVLEALSLSLPSFSRGKRATGGTTVMSGIAKPIIEIFGITGSFSKSLRELDFLRVSLLNGEVSASLAKDLTGVNGDSGALLILLESRAAGSSTRRLGDSGALRTSTGTLYRLLSLSIGQTAE